MVVATEDRDCWVKPEVLRALREEAGLQTRDVEVLARDLVKYHYAPVTQRDLESWERGIGCPELGHLETLSEIYKCPVGVFFLEEVPPPGYLSQFNQYYPSDIVGDDDDGTDDWW